ncbi:ComF family protein [Peteryoungia desertarenae]|nr:ComF family protein [Peteryoungia desertarenae]
MQKVVNVSRLFHRNTFSRLSDLLYPPCCAHCHIHTGSHRALCPSCWSEIRFIERPFCDVLGTPFAYDEGEGAVSPEAIANPPAFDRLRSATVHDGVARHLVHALKYRDRTDLAPMMASWMARAARAELHAADAIIPVPLHRLRMFRRMFNQSAELGRHLAMATDRAFLPEALIRRKRTEQQIGLTANARALNVRNAFLVPEGREDLVFGRRLVLVDDVYTTGATVNAAAKALRRAGAADITVLTFARALGQPI